jgi:hypothetical protein
MGVSVDTIAKPFEANLARRDDFPITDSLTGGNVFSWVTVNKAWANGKQLFRNMETGDFSLTARDGFRPVHRPRIALYKSFVPSMDEGWTRWLLENFGFEYKNVLNGDLQTGNLRERFDAIVFPDQRSAVIHSGHRPGSMPDEFTGGVGDAGAEALKKFVSQGGAIVFLNEATEYALEHLNVPVRNVVHGLSNREFYCPGSLLNVKLDNAHPLTLGLPKDVALWSESSPAFEIGDGSRNRAIATYPAANVLASGWLLGEKYLINRAAILDVPLGSGHVILFGGRPQYRAQSYQAFKMFFNSLVYFE